MDATPTIVERAFELADSGKSLVHIRTQLIREGYDQSHLTGPMIRRQLAARIAAAKTAAAH